VANVRIQTDDNEPIEVLVVDPGGIPLTGLTNLKLRVRRRSDDNFFDWLDNTFKPAASVVQIDQMLIEINATFAPGKYKLDSASHIDGFDTSVIANPADDDIYFFTATQDGAPQNVANVPQVGQISVGDYLDFIDARISDIQDDFVVLMTLSLNQDNDRLDIIAWIENRNLLFNTPAVMGICTVSVYDKDGAVQFTATSPIPDAQGIYKIEKTAPGLVADQLYYATASIPVTIAPGSVVSGAKGMFTL